MDTKPWYASLTFDALVVLLVVSVAGMLGLDLSAEESTVGDMVRQVAELATIVLAMYGRLRAQKKITLTK